MSCVRRTPASDSRSRGDFSSGARGDTRGTTADGDAGGEGDGSCFNDETGVVARSRSTGDFSAAATDDARAPLDASVGADVPPFCSGDEGEDAGGEGDCFHEGEGDSPTLVDEAEGVVGEVLFPSGGFVSRFQFGAYWRSSAEGVFCAAEDFFCGTPPVSTDCSCVAAEGAAADLV